MKSSPPPSRFRCRVCSDASPITALRQTRSGFTLVEMSVALMMLGVLIVTVIPLLHALRRYQHEAERRQWALTEAGNVLETCTAHFRQGTLTDEILRACETPTNLEEHLPLGRLELRTQELPATDSGRPVMKELSVVISWENDNQLRPPPVRLTTWLMSSERN